MAGGKNHLRAAIGSGEYQEEFVSEKVSDLVNEKVQLVEFLRYSQRHATQLLPQISLKYH